MINGLIFLTLGIVMITVVLTAINAGQFVAEISLKRLASENRDLVSQLRGLNNTLVEHNGIFNEYIDQGARARSFWQMPGIHPEIWSMGVGGKKTDTAPKYLSSGTKSMLYEIYDAVDVLENKCQLKLSSYEEIHERIDEKYRLWRHIPSINPVPGYNTGSGFGYRVDPIDKRTIRMHEGVDISAPRGTSIIASADGVVSYTGWNLGYGLQVDIDHGYGFRTRYAHCSSLYVSVGDFVKRGQVIAAIGSTGRTTCSHLHYEVHVSGVKVNPSKYIDQSNILFD